MGSRAVRFSCASSLISSDDHARANRRTPSALRAASRSASQTSAADLNSGDREVSFTGNGSFKKSAPASCDQNAGPFYIFIHGSTYHCMHDVVKLASSILTLEHIT
jgi:hypothetical protein